MGGRLAAVWEGRGGMEKKKKEKHRKRVSVDGWEYNGFYRWNHRKHNSVGDSIGESATSLYDYLSLNPSVISSVKSSDVTTPLHIFRQTVYPVGETVGIYRQKYFCRYIPTVSPTDIGRRYIPTDFETELCPTVIITDVKISSVIPLVFSDFLVVSVMIMKCIFNLLFSISEVLVILTLNVIIL
jgi:hypothetical protein